VPVFKALGWLLIRWGAKLAFKSDDDMRNLKHHVNLNTWIGSQSDSGGHTLSKINPMCDYDTQSVINVLRIPQDDNSIKNTLSKKIEYYEEKWKH